MKNKEFNLFTHRGLSLIDFLLINTFFFFARIICKGEGFWGGGVEKSKKKK